MSNKDTKEQILAVAAKLFLKFGYGGSSIRDIANESGVNLSAINYHFGSKSNLYWAAICNTHTWGRQQVQALADKSKDTTELAINIFNFVLNNKQMFNNTIRLFLTEGVPDPSTEVSKTMENQIGSPGIPILKSFLQKELGKDLSEEAAYMGASSIFGLIFNFSLIFSSNKIEILKRQESLLTEDNVRDIIKYNVEAILEYLKNNEIKLSTGA
jgi:AcrR family transcriptional regulator